MAFVKLAGKFETDVPEEAYIVVNTENLTFITPGPSEESHGKTYQQMYFHFLGSISSTGFWVEDGDAAVTQLMG